MTSGSTFICIIKNQKEKKTGLTAVSTATWVRIPTTRELTFWHRQGQRTDT